MPHSRLLVGWFSQPNSVNITHQSAELRPIVLPDFNITASVTEQGIQIQFRDGPVVVPYFHAWQGARKAEHRPIVALRMMGNLPKWK